MLIVSYNLNLENPAGFCPYGKAIGWFLRIADYIPGMSTFYGKIFWRNENTDFSAPLVLKNGKTPLVGVVPCFCLWVIQESLQNLFSKIYLSYASFTRLGPL